MYRFMTTIKKMKETPVHPNWHLKNQSWNLNFNKIIHKLSSNKNHQSLQLQLSHLLPARKTVLDLSKMIKQVRIQLFRKRWENKMFITYMKDRLKMSVSSLSLKVKAALRRKIKPTKMVSRKRSRRKNKQKQKRKMRRQSRKERKLNKKIRKRQ